MTDTDSFVYEIKTEDFYEDIKGMQEHYDMIVPWYKASSSSPKVLSKGMQEHCDMIVPWYKASSSSPKAKSTL
jgi:hypothetical protein